MTKDRLEKLIGPRITRQEIAAGRMQFIFPTLCLGLAGLLMIASIFLPYWHMELQAPQYPSGLHVQAFLNHLEGDVAEIDGLNHYIGMRPLGEAAELERSLSVAAVVVIALLVIAAVYIHNQYAALLSLPAVLFPAIFLLDLYYWMRHFGTNLDPAAPLSSAIKPFVPPILGLGKVGQFATVASAGSGLILASLASLIILLGLFLHRRAYRPLVEAHRG
ncbi:MAG: cytochrome C [Thermoanaerobaculia bacterium]|nr:cytochrome C [Thermoanaerobaculia bacterium]